MTSLSMETAPQMSVSRKQRSLRWILSPVIVIGIHALILLYIIWQPQEEVTEQSPAAAPIVVTMATLPTTSQLSTVQSEARQAATTPPPVADTSHTLDAEQKIIKNDEVQAAVQPHKPHPVKKHTPPSKKVPQHPREVKPLPKAPVRVKKPDTVTTPASVQSNSSERLSHQNQAPVVGAASNQQADSRQNWQSAILARLQQAKRYPAYARRMHQEDIVMVKFTLNRDGQVLDSEVIKSQGYAALDREAESLPSRVSPLPKPPASAFAEGASEMTLTVPIAFVLH